MSVRCVSALGQSHDNHCTILVGKGKYPDLSIFYPVDYKINALLLLKTFLWG